MTTYADLLDAYLDTPSPKRLAALRRAVRAAPGFDPDLRVSRSAAVLLARGADAEAVDLLEAAMPGALFSAGAHARLAQALRRTGRSADADRHARLARAALDSVLATGDGSAARPWSVLRVGDEHDLLDSQGRRPERQALVERAGRSLDRVACTDGTEAWFDVTDLVAPVPSRSGG